MQTPISASLPLDARQAVTRKDLLELAGFSDESSLCVSFYFSLASSPDTSHRAEVVMIKDLKRKSRTGRTRRAA